MKFRPNAALSLLLAALLTAFSSCAQSAGNADEPAGASQTAGAGDTADTPAPETAPEEDADDFSEYMPAGDFDGYEFCILKSSDISWCLDEVWAEGITGEAYTDAIYNRNARIGDNLNIVITQYDGGVDAAIKSSVAAGDDAYAIAYPSLSSAAAVSFLKAAGIIRAAALRFHAVSHHAAFAAAHHAAHSGGIPDCHGC